jgi:hypothetical protein
VTQVLYSGEKNALAATDAYCAPILNTCLDHLGQIKAEAAPTPTPTPTPASPPAP